MIDFTEKSLRYQFGDVLPGETTDYQVVSRGVYRYAGYKIELNGQDYQQVPYDFLGESPMNGNVFTYVLILDPNRKTDPVQKTGIEVIQLVQGGFAGVERYLEPGWQHMGLER